MTFERIALACRWLKQDWVFHLIPLLTGKARGAYVHLDMDDSRDYDKIRAAILHKYEVQWDESPKELYACLKELYGKWVKPK